MCAKPHHICYKYTMNIPIAETNKKNIITIGGKPGSGKSTASKAVAEFLGYEHFSSGDLFRAISRERNLDVHAGNLAAEKDADIDHLVDQRLREIGEQQNNVAIDSRMAWHWIPGSFKVYLDLDMEVAAQRIIDKMDAVRLAAEHIPDNPKEYAAILSERQLSESRRYKKLYNVDPFNLSHYDLVLDTNKYSVDEVLHQILEKYEAWLTS